MRRTARWRLAGLAILLSVAVGPDEGWAWPTDEQIHELLRIRVDSMRQAPGMVVGMVEPAGVRFVSFGVASLEDGRPVDERTIFEIGSVTKVLTAALLADMMVRGEFALMDPIEKYLPPTIDFPTHVGGPVRVRDLILHRSGLPTEDFGSRDHEDETPEELDTAAFHEYLSRLFLLDGGAKYRYSELDYAVLGAALAHRSGMTYEVLLQARLSDILDMPDTRLTLTPDQKLRRASGYRASWLPAPRLESGIYASATGSHSTAVDLTRFVAASTGELGGPLWKALRIIQLDREDARQPEERLAMGWHVVRKRGHEVLIRRGATYGHTSFVGIDREGSRGVVVLANANTMIDDLGLHLLDERFALASVQPDRVPDDNAVSPEDVESHVGRWEITPGEVIRTHLADDGLALQLPGALPERLVPLGRGEYRMASAPIGLQFTFTLRKAIRRVRLDRYGLEQDLHRAKAESVSRQRYSLSSHPVPFVGPAHFERDSIQVMVSEAGGALCIERTGQAALKLLPVGEDTYWSQEADAEVTFTDSSITITQDDSTLTLSRVDVEAAP